MLVPWPDYVLEGAAEYWYIAAAPLAVGAVGVAILWRQRRIRPPETVLTTALLCTLCVWLFAICYLSWEGLLWFEAGLVSDGDAALYRTTWGVFMLLSFGASVSAMLSSAAFALVALLSRKHPSNSAR